jgi:hypothetical protein
VRGAQRRAPAAARAEDRRRCLGVCAAHECSLLVPMALARSRRGEAQGR